MARLSEGGPRACCGGKAGAEPGATYHHCSSIQNHGSYVLPEVLKTQVLRQAALTANSCLCQGPVDMRANTMADNDLGTFQQSRAVHTPRIECRDMNKSGLAL
jgi:hypothetical protein